MKKLILLVSILLIVGGCSLEYKDIKPKEPLSGTLVTIDSTQWTPVLMQVYGDKLIILDKGEIREISLIDNSVYGLVFIIVIVFILLLYMSFLD